jgi:hypothetical protein
MAHGSMKASQYFKKAIQWTTNSRQHNLKGEFTKKTILSVYLCQGNNTKIKFIPSLERSQIKFVDHSSS